MWLADDFGRKRAQKAGGRIINSLETLNLGAGERWERPGPAGALAIEP